MVHLYLDRLDAAVIAPSSHFCVEAPISSRNYQYVTSFPEKKLLLVHSQFFRVADKMLDYWLREY